MTIQQLLEITVSRNASDLHLVAGFPATLKINGELSPIPGEEVLSSPQIEELVASLLSEDQKQIFTVNLELDFSYELPQKARFRINMYKQKGTLAVSFRYIPYTIRTPEELGFPKVVTRITELKQGFILVTGPTGHGKSTALAGFVNKINMERPVHIITIEDPIEYVYPKGKSIISQREVNSDTKSWNNALRASLREDPDVVLIGEMRDLETISSAMTIAETGHLVFATLHTNSAAQSVDRIIDVFPENQQPQIRLQLASTLEAILSLRLVPTIAPGRTLAMEILFANPAVRSNIRDGKTYLIDNLIQTSAELGMMSLETSLSNLVKSGKISSEVALKFAIRPELLSKLLH